MDASASGTIELRGLTKRYPDGTVAVHELDLDIPAGEICVLVGPSGCGKTTTMRMINRLVEPTAGTIRIDGRDVRSVDPKELRRHIGYVIQATGLFPHQTVRRNVATVCVLLGWDKARTAERVDELLTLVGLDPQVYGDRYPHQLSGGQRQRVGVARALAADPPVLLMDEPFGAVDPIARDRLQEEFLALQAKVAKTVVMVTHDIDEAVRMGDRIVVMREGGYLEQVAGPAEILASPVNDFVAGFVGSDRILKLMAVTEVDPAVLAPLNGQDEELPAVSAGATLRDVAVAVLTAPDGRARVLAGDGSALGTITMEGVRRSLRAPSD
jgi:osmoprotectant transport system ATP-binding protein